MLQIFHIRKFDYWEKSLEFYIVLGHVWNSVVYIREFSPLHVNLRVKKKMRPFFILK